MTDFSYAKRSLWRFFEVNGIPRTEPEGRNGGRIDITFPYATDAERKNAWLHDSLLWTIEMIEAGELKLAFRGYVQATGYRAEVPGHGGSNASDLWSALRNYFEAVFEQTEVNNQQLEEVIADAREGQGLDLFLFEILRHGEHEQGGIVRARSMEMARSEIREWIAQVMPAPAGTYRFRMFRPFRVDGVMVTTFHTPIYEGE